ncbi:MAG TPA: hypothetical protein VG122_20440 [Gemmata sp.]|jgi:hypothetical protein|nr:hypothetical protein [Gemmata sp.]
MADGADVRSIDAVRDWHAALAEYGDGLAEALAGVELEIRRAHDWLEEQLGRWQRAIRDYEEEVTRAKAELSQRKFPTWDGREPDCTVQEKALRLAKARLEHAEDQVEKCRRWLGRLPKMVDEVYVGASRRLANFVEAELPKGLADLARRVAALESYSGLRPDYAPTPMGSSVAASPPSPSPQEGGEGKTNSPSSASKKEEQRGASPGTGEG